MRTGVKITLEFAGILAIASAVYCAIPKEPKWLGRGISDWLVEFDGAGSRNEAAAAVRQIGTRSLPYIITELKAYDPPWKLKLIELVKKQGVLSFRYTADIVRRQRAIAACQALGPVAKPAIPALGQALGYGSGAALSVLERFGPEAVTALAEALTNAPACSPPYGTALVLGKMGANAKAAIPSLVWTFENHKISSPRRAAASALASICNDLIEKTHQSACAEVQVIKAVLVRGLSSSNRVEAAVHALGQLGSHADEAAPVLVQLLKDPNPNIRAASSNALKSVAPAMLAATAIEK